MAHKTETEKFAEEFGEREGFDPATIMALIQAIITAFANCKKPPTPAAVKNLGPFGHARAVTVVCDHLDLPRDVAGE